MLLKKKNDPKDPEIVFLGLIFVSFFPLMILPVTNPPISVNIDINNAYTRASFNSVFIDLMIIIKYVKKAR